MKNWPDSRILVTGGAGLIGSALVWALNQRGCENIVICDRLGADEKWRNLTPLRFSDYLDADDLRPRLQNGSLGKFDCLLHLGACSATTERNASYLMRNNYEFTKDLAAWSLAQDTRFVYASSAATYGDGTHGMSDIDALDPLRPLNAYGYSKHIFDLHAQRAGFLNRIVGLKYFNVFGPNEDHKGEMRSVVHKAYGQVCATGAIQLFKSYNPEYPDGGQKRDFLYVKDAVAMTLHLAASASAGGLFNIGSGKANTWLDLAHAIFGALDREPRVEFIEMPDPLRGKYQYFTQADITKLRTTRYEGDISSLREAVADYVRHYLAPDKRLGEEHKPTASRR
jgi:ADP-L-glycero-D-manno-heptose 6-epimerase